MKRFLLALLLPLAGGCSDKPPIKDSHAPIAQADAPFFPRGDRALDAVPDIKMLVNLSVYHIAVPARSVSHNEEFWKHVDEHAVDVATYDLLFANGFRIGIAPQSDWEYFKKILYENTVVSRKTGAAGIAATVIEMPMKENVLQQFITYFHPSFGLTGQLYDRCDNAMTIRFEPVKGRPGDVRVNVTPLLRSHRTTIMYTVRNEAQELDFVHEEHLFDMKLTADVPVNSFLIVAPSAIADDSIVLGHNFLYAQDKGQQYEELLVISPQPFQFEKAPEAAPATQPAVTAR